MQVSARLRLVGCVTALVLSFGACRRSTSPSAPDASSTSNAAAAPTPPTPIASFVAPGAARAFRSARSAGTRIYVRRDGDDVRAFGESGNSAWSSALQGKVAPDGSVALGPGSGAPAVMTIALGKDGTIVLQRAPTSDAGKATTVPLVDNVPFGAAEDADFESGYAGRLGERIGIRADIHRTQGALSGFYRYARSRLDLKLAGTVDASGAFTMSETNDKGVVTGRWEGIFLSRNAVAGTWSSADGARRLPFALASAPRLTMLGQGMAQVTEQEREVDAGFGCYTTTTLPVVSDLAPAARNAKVNARLKALADEAGKEGVSCDGTEPMLPWWSDVAVTVEAQGPGYVAVQVGSGGYTGGAHPNYGGHCALIDTQTGELASLSSILGEAAVAAIAHEVTDDLRGFWKDNELDDAAGESDVALDDDHLCYASPTKVVARYSVYEVAPYAYGAPTFDVDVSALVEKMPPGAGRKGLFGK